MRRYINAVNDIRRHLLSPDVDLHWHDKKTERELSRLFADIEELLKFKPELTEERQAKLQQIHDLMLKLYADYKVHKSPEKLTAKDLDAYLISVADWFNERYKFVSSNKFLRNLYRKIGCGFLFGKKVEVEGGTELKGPAVIITTHHYEVESSLIQAITPTHIFWIGDPRFWIFGKGIRHFSIPILGWLYKKLGILEINRDEPRKGLLSVIKKCIHVLEHKKLVGIMPVGGTDREAGLYEIGPGGAVFIIQKAQQQMGKRIPIIPIGVKKDKTYRVRIGKPLYLPTTEFDRNSYSRKLITYLEELAS